ncbi:MAG: flagellar basal-body MS-ring/collar protein FliF [Alphaproteobacteria bacterium]|nr:flagellar basal-body MS-ring/collar protein FliF [Alphaproteobacteria bacterium]
MNTMVQSLKGLNQIKLAAMIGTAVVMIAFFAYISLRVAAPTMAPLYNSIPVEDGGKIIAELELENIPYELRRDGTQIMVPSDQVDKLRLKLAQKGLPSQGSVIGYEIFDKANTLGTSNFVLNINQVRALEGELSRTIASFDTVEQARVHLVNPKRELFSREATEPTASVAVKLRSSAGLNKNEIAAIRNLVASAVPGLKAQRVTVVDSRGIMLAKGVEDLNNPNTVSEDSESFRSEYEQNTVARLERLLEQSVGIGKVKAEVHAEIDFNRTVKNSEKYDPEGQVARSVQTVKEDETANEQSSDTSVSAANNLPAAPPAAGNTNASNRKRVEETTNFEISKEVTNSIKEAGIIKRLSVAILVDGIYTPDSDGKPQFAPRSEEELKKLEKLVQSSIGYDATRGDDVSVVTMQFAAAPEDMFTTSPLDWLKQDFNSIIQTLVLGGVAILAILLVIRPLVARAIESAEAAAKEDEMEQAALAAPSIAVRLTDQSRKIIKEEEDEALEEPEDMINIDRIQGKLRSSSYSKINSMVDKHPEETAQILRQWLSAS